MAPPQTQQQQQQQPLSDSLPSLLSFIALNNPPHLSLACLQTLLTLHTNLSQHPTEDKYRKVKASTNAFNPVLEAKNGTTVLSQTGWKKSVEEFQEVYRYQPLPDPVLEQHRLNTAISLISSAKHQAELAHLKHKEKREKDASTKREELERVRRDIENDKLDRKEKMEREKMVRASLVEREGMNKGGTEKGAGEPTAPAT